MTTYAPVVRVSNLGGFYPDSAFDKKNGIGSDLREKPDPNQTSEKKPDLILEKNPDPT